MTRRTCLMCKNGKARTLRAESTDGSAYTCATKEPVFCTFKCAAHWALITVQGTGDDGGNEWCDVHACWMLGGACEGGEHDVLCRNCNSGSHERCCLQCGAIFNAKQLREGLDYCSPKCAREQAREDKLSAAQEEPLAGKHPYGCGCNSCDLFRAEYGS